MSFLSEALRELDLTEQRTRALAERAQQLETENHRLRARVANLEASDMAHRLAVMLECALLDRGRAWDEAFAVLDEFRAQQRAITERTDD